MLQIRKYYFSNFISRNCFFFLYKIVLQYIHQTYSFALEFILIICFLCKVVQFWFYLTQMQYNLVNVSAVQDKTSVFWHVGWDKFFKIYNTHILFLKLRGIDNKTIKDREFQFVYICFIVSNTPLYGKNGSQVQSAVKGTIFGLTPQIKLHPTSCWYP